MKNLKEEFYFIGFLSLGVGGVVYLYYHLKKAKRKKELSNRIAMGIRG